MAVFPSATSDVSAGEGKGVALDGVPIGLERHALRRDAHGQRYRARPPEHGLVAATTGPGDVLVGTRRVVPDFGVRVCCPTAVPTQVGSVVRVVIRSDAVGIPIKCRKQQARLQQLQAVPGRPRGTIPHDAAGEESPRDDTGEAVTQRVGHGGPPLLRWREETRPGRRPVGDTGLGQPFPHPSANTFSEWVNALSREKPDAF